MQSFFTPKKIKSAPAVYSSAERELTLDQLLIATQDLPLQEQMDALNEFKAEEVSLIQHSLRRSPAFIRVNHRLAELNITRQVEPGVSLSQDFLEEALGRVSPTH